MMDKTMYNLSRIYGRWGMKAQMYSMVNPKGLPGKLRFMWHAYRVTLAMILVFALMLFLQNLVIFWGAFAAAVVCLYIKGALEEVLDRSIAQLRREGTQEKENDDDREQHPV